MNGVVLALVGVLTFYAGPYVGQPLRCGGTYSETSGAWIAVDLEATRWRCGDDVQVWQEGVLVETLKVRDSGPLSRYCVMDGEECVPIVGDVPAHAAWWCSGPSQCSGCCAMSTRARLVNLSATRRVSQRGRGGKRCRMRR